MDGQYNQQLQLAASYSLETWIPIEEALYHEIRSGLTGGRYQSGRDLYEDLIKDPALYFHCLRRLIELKRQEPGWLDEEVDPVAIFDGPEVIQHMTVLFSSSPSLISRHRLSESSDIQARTITNSLVSSAVAGALAKRENVDAELASSSALFRQLGLLLIAYNYPHVFARVLKPGSQEQEGAPPPRASSPGSTDAALASLLGFSPTLLGVTIARFWSISAKVRNAMGDSTADLAEESESKRQAEVLDKICRIGEMFARATSPDLFPSAPLDWETAREQITMALGPKELTTLEGNLRGKLEHYLKNAPQLFQLPPQMSKEKLLGDQTGQQRVPENKYVAFCPLDFHNTFKEFYTRLSPERIEKENVDFLIQKLVVPLGFSRGCVYLLEPDSLSLVPRLAVGDARLTHFKPLSYQNFADRDDAIIAAFRSQIPIAGEAESSSGKVSYIAGSLGECQRAGVLYLEISKRSLYDQNANPLVCFKALREAFSACLWLT